MTDHLARRDAPPIDRTSPVMSGRAGMRPLTPHLIDFLDAHRVGVLATVDKVAMPRQSVVYYVREEQRLLISTESKRLKARDVGARGGPRSASSSTSGRIPPRSSPARPRFSREHRPRDGRDRAPRRRLARAAGGAERRSAGGHRPRDSGDHRRGRGGRQLPADRDRGSSFVNRDSDRRRCCSRRRSTAATAMGASATPQTVPAIVSDG